MVGAAWLLLLITASGLARTSDEPRQLTRVYAPDEAFRALIREGDTRSQTFRAMVDEIQASNTLVVIQFGLCANGRARSCVAQVIGNAHARTIRVLIDSRTTRDRVIATIAHELQHALEIIRSGAVDANQVMALYRGIGLGDCGAGRSDRCETEAAQAVEEKVLIELES
jgi:hypothetical protein